LILESYKGVIQDYTDPSRTPPELEHLSLTPNYSYTTFTSWKMVERRALLVSIGGGD
jgi:hypothetical protein